MVMTFVLILLKCVFSIGITSFVLVWWAQRKGYVGDATSMKEYGRIRKAEKELRKETRRLRKEARKNAKKSDSSLDSPELEKPAEKKKYDLLHGKWMNFGGGFYGVVAVFTYALIELAEVKDFILNIADLFNHGMISLVVNFFIESIKNFVAAIGWPAYWLRRIQGEQWFWLVSAYAGYWLGSWAAFRARKNLAG